MKDKHSIPPALRPYTIHMLRRAGDKAFDIAKKHMESTAGITAREWGVLQLANDEPQSQQSLADALGMDRQGMVIIIDRLEKRGYVKRTSNPDDRRHNLIKVTAKGLTVYRSGVKALATMQDELFARLTADERATLQDLLLKILE